MRGALFLVSVLGLWEFYSFFWSPRQNALLKALAFVAAGVLTLMPPAISSTYLPYALPLIFCSMGVYFLILFSLFGDSARCGDFMIAAAGLLYIPLILRLVLVFSISEILLALAVVFATDTAAFYAGSWWGKRRIWPSISPKKTWTGSLAGLGVCILVTAVAGLIWGKVSLWQFLVLGVVLNLAAQLGDFFESAVKRRCNIKDSGSTLPGHGGILDRIDSLLFLLPVFALFTKLLKFF